MSRRINTLFYEWILRLNASTKSLPQLKWRHYSWYSSLRRFDFNNYLYSQVAYVTWIMTSEKRSPTYVVYHFDTQRWSPTQKKLVYLTIYESYRKGARCSSVFRAFAHGAMGRRIDPSWSNHWTKYRSNLCSTTGVTKTVVYVLLSVWWCI